MSQSSAFQFPHVTGCICVIFVPGGPMLSHLCAALTPALYTLWITMAYVAGQEDREKTTALKGKTKSSFKGGSNIMGEEKTILSAYETEL